MGRFWWVVIGVMALFSVILRHNLLFLASLVLALLAGVSEVWGRHCLTAVSYRRRFGSRRLFFGEETDLYVEVVNAKPLPLAWLRTLDEFPNALALVSGQLTQGYLPNRRTLANLFSLRWYERVLRHYRLQGVQRGVWEFGPARLMSGDIFGFAIRRETLEDVDEILVYPRMVAVTALGLPARHPFGDFQDPRRLFEDPLRLMSVREYVQGDSFRHIHWKATARRRELQTKVFEPTASRTLVLFLNASTFTYIYEGLDAELQEYAITAAASVGRWAWQNDYAVGLYTNAILRGSGKRARIQPGSHPDQLLRLLDVLARIHGPGRWPIESVLQVEADKLRYGATVVVITPTMSPGLRRGLAELRRRGHGVVLMALGKARLEEAISGIVYYHLGGHDRWHELETLELA